MIPQNEMSEKMNFQADHPEVEMAYVPHLLANWRVAVRCLALAGFHFIHGIIPVKQTSHGYWNYWMDEIEPVSEAEVMEIEQNYLEAVKSGRVNPHEGEPPEWFKKLVEARRLRDE